MTPQITQAQTIANSLRDKVNPMIRGNFAAARRNLKEGFNNPLGAATTPAIREATLRSGNQELDQAEAGALENAAFTANQTDFERQMNIAQMTSPQLVQTGGTQTQSGGGIGNFVNGLVSAGASVGSAALT